LFGPFHSSSWESTKLRPSPSTVDVPDHIIGFRVSLLVSGAHYRSISWSIAGFRSRAGP
jgi:hypothetical protein